MYLYLLMMGGLLVCLVSILFLIISFKKFIDLETLSSYECGFNHMSEVRCYFSYRFFLISILFLIFDVEIALMLPIPWGANSVVGVQFFFFFILVLILGLVYEYKCGSLSWL